MTDREWQIKELKSLIKEAKEILGLPDKDNKK